jgi:hypothetical protein
VGEGERRRAEAKPIVERIEARVVETKARLDVREGEIVVACMRRWGIRKGRELVNKMTTRGKASGGEDMKKRDMTSELKK